MFRTLRSSFANKIPLSSYLSDKNIEGSYLTLVEVWTDEIQNWKVYIVSSTHEEDQFLVCGSLTLWKFGETSDINSLFDSIHIFTRMQYSIFPYMVNFTHLSLEESKYWEENILVWLIPTFLSWANNWFFQYLMRLYGHFHAMYLVGDLGFLKFYLVVIIHSNSILMLSRDNEL